MSRLPRVLLVAGLIIFGLACNFVTQPIRDAQEVVGTVQSVASSMPLETLQALGTALPIQTVEAFVTSIPQETLEAVPTELANYADVFNPQGEPVSEWNGIPIMEQAAAGQEHDANNYSFKFTGTTKEAQDFYDAQMKELGWESTFSMPSEASGAVLVFTKESKFLSITIITTDGNTVVLLTLA